jgi:hypothetical protein
VPGKPGGLVAVEPKPCLIMAAWKVTATLGEGSDSEAPHSQPTLSLTARTFHLACTRAAFHKPAAEQNGGSRPSLRFTVGDVGQNVFCSGLSPGRLSTCRADSLLLQHVHPARLCRVSRDCYIHTPGWVRARWIRSR